MSETSTGSAIEAGRGPKNPVLRFFFHHEIGEYPTGTKRMAYLAIAVLATITLYYTYYTQTGVTPQILAGLHMSFRYYVGIVVISNALGAFASLPASKTDKFGRSNVVIYGLLLIGAIIAFWVPHTHSAFSFGAAISVMGIIEGAVLVATPSLVRDYSPQMGRASAMGFWTVGPVAGSFIVSIVARNTLEHMTAWQDQFVISGIASIVVFVIALIALKDLAPQVRDQLMVSEQDKALIQARALGISDEEIAKGTAHPWRQILSWPLVGSAFGISVFLLLYFVAASFFTIYYVVTFTHPNGLPFTTADANWLNSWFWGADIVSLIVVGWISDKVLVRKPFMLAGAGLSILFTIIFLLQATHPHTSRSTLALLGCLIAFGLSLAYAPWMAGYTETIEAKNPALVATGLALWGWILRLVVAVSFLFLPVVISTVSPIVDNTALATGQIPACNLAPATATLAAIPGPAVPVGQSASTFNVEHPDSVVFANAHTALLNELSANYRVVEAATAPNASVVAQLKALTVLGPATVAQAKLYETRIDTLVNPYHCQLVFLQAHKTELNALQANLAKSPKQWQHWFWIDVAGMVVFIPFIFLTKGRWSPKKARKDVEENEKRVAEELAALRRG
jgi:MFS family permease